MAEHSLELARNIRREAAQLGFAAIGFSTPHPQRVAAEHFKAMITEKRHGEMAFMEKRMEERTDPVLLLPGLKTVISAAVSYHHLAQRSPGQPVIAQYALTADYHTVVRQMLEALLTRIRELIDEPLSAVITVDSAPLLEKAWAEEAGIGKTGKNTLLIVPSAGSYVFLGELLLDREIIDPRAPLPNLCGSCSLCIESCPTGALVEAGKIDATRCISYLTVELKREFTEQEAEKIGDRLFGCDRCQEVCPHNRTAHIPPPPAFALQSGVMNLTTEAILNLTRSGFSEHFGNTPIFRIGLRRMKRNARAVAENLKKTEAPPR